MRFSASSLILFICFSSFKVVNHCKDIHNIYCGDIFLSTLKIVINNRYCRLNYFFRSDNQLLQPILMLRLRYRL